MATVVGRAVLGIKLPQLKLTTNTGGSAIGLRGRSTDMGTGTLVSPSPFTIFSG